MRIFSNLNKPLDFGRKTNFGKKLGAERTPFSDFKDTMYFKFYYTVPRRVSQALVCFCLQNE